MTFQICIFGNIKTADLLFFLLIPPPGVFISSTFWATWMYEPSDTEFGWKIDSNKSVRKRYSKPTQAEIGWNIFVKLTTISIKYPSKTCAVPFATTPLLGASIGGRALKGRWWKEFLQTEFWHSPWGFCRILGWLCSTSCDRRNLWLVQLYVITSTWGFSSKKLWLKYDEEGRVSQTELS